VNGFNTTQVGVALRWAPNDKYMEGPFGRRPIDLSYPVYKIQYTRGVPDVWGSNYEFDKIDVAIEYRFKTKRFGESKFELAGGYVHGELPYSLIYTSVANRPVNVNWPVQPAGMYAFETMFNNEFISNAWAHFVFRQNFKGYLFKIGKFNPHVEWMFGATFGSLNNPEQHQNVEFKTLEKGYYETGIEFNKIYQGLGVGFYYRMGPYQLPKQIDNFSIKFTARLDFF
jgi:hypothetical protein